MKKIGYTTLILAAMFVTASAKADDSRGDCKEDKAGDWHCSHDAEREAVEYTPPIGPKVIFVTNLQPVEPVPPPPCKAGDKRCKKTPAPVPPPTPGPGPAPVYETPQTSRTLFGILGTYVLHTSDHHVMGGLWLERQYMLGNGWLFGGGKAAAGNGHGQGDLGTLLSAHLGYQLENESWTSGLRFGLVLNYRTYPNLHSVPNELDNERVIDLAAHIGLMLRSDKSAKVILFLEPGIGWRTRAVVGGPLTTHPFTFNAGVALVF